MFLFSGSTIEPGVRIRIRKGPGPAQHWPAETSIEGTYLTAQWLSWSGLFIFSGSTIETRCSDTDPQTPGSGSALACWKRRANLPESPVIVMVRPVSIFWKYNGNPDFGYGAAKARVRLSTGLLKQA
jgi:hypothetical protein